MVLSEVDICNLALAQLGGKFSITSLDDETVGAQLCKANYAPLRDAVLEEMDWSFAIKEHALAADPVKSLIGSYTRYKIPADTLRVLAVYDGWGKVEDWHMEARFILAQTDGLIIKSLDSTNDTSLFSQAFTQALAARLSAELAMPLTNAVAVSTAQWQLYAQKVSLARTNDSLQGSSINYPTARIIRARRGN